MDNRIYQEQVCLCQFRRMRGSKPTRFVTDDSLFAIEIGFWTACFGQTTTEGTLMENLAKMSELEFLIGVKHDSRMVYDGIRTV